MALTDKELERFGDRAAALMQAFEQDTIADIARRVKKTGRFTETAELMALAMRDAGADTQKIRAEVMKTLRADKAYQKEVANNTKQYKRDIMHRIRQLQKEAENAGNSIIAESGDMAFNKDMWAWHQAGKRLTKDSAIVRMMKEMSESTVGTFKNITQSMGFKGEHNFTSIQNAYYNALDKAVLKVATGTFSFDQAVNDCIRELAQSGLRTVDYASGRSYQLDTAARMCVRTSCHQMSARISMHNCERTGTDLVEVDAHWGAREEHAAWQGKIYSRSGKHKKYPDFKVCRYGEADGLCGVNCRHTFYPFFEGISEPNKWEPEPSPKKYNGKTYSYYDATQKQRQMERNVRATKREIEAQKAIGGDTKLLEAKKRKQISEYHAFSNAMGIRAKDNRLRVVKGSSDLGKTKMYSKAVKNPQSRFAFHTENDPIREYIGSAEETNPEKLNEMIKDMEKSGVVITRRKGVMGYFPGTVKGSVGNVNMEEGASISAWLHEYQHFCDDRADGYLGFRVLQDPEKSAKREIDAYQIEIDYAQSLGYNDVVEKLKKLRDEEVKKYV